MSKHVYGSKGYEGWKNRATWNVALWVSNDEGLYNAAVDYAKMRKRQGKQPSWTGFIEYSGLKYDKTPDRFSYDGSQLDRKALSEMLKELVD
jgi:hypothetical protein